MRISVGESYICIVRRVSDGELCYSCLCEALLVSYVIHVYTNLCWWELLCSCLYESRLTSCSHSCLFGFPFSFLPESSLFGCTSVSIYLLCCLNFSCFINRSTLWVDPVASSHSPSPASLDCFGECLCCALYTSRLASEGARQYDPLKVIEGS
jgi:hypothetical protein